jgi:hypothetical protein
MVSHRFVPASIKPHSDTNAIRYIAFRIAAADLHFRQDFIPRECCAGKAIKAGAMTAQISPIFAIALLGNAALATPASAEQVSREPDIVELRLGQRILVDDGSCPAGQIKEVAGAQLTANGVVRRRKCIPRLGSKKR